MIAIVDFETGGIDPARHAIVSVGVLLLDSNLEEIDRYYTIINDPGKLVEDDALAVNGLTRQEIANGLPVGQALSRVRELVNGVEPSQANIFAAHNARFDARIFNLRAGANVQTAIDTLRLSYRVWPYPAKARLVDVCARMKIPTYNLHNALEDVLLTAEVLRRFAAMPLKPPALEPQRIEWNWKPWQ